MEHQAGLKSPAANPVEREALRKMTDDGLLRVGLGADGRDAAELDGDPLEDVQVEKLSPAGCCFHDGVHYVAQVRWRGGIPHALTEGEWAAYRAVFTARWGGAHA